MSFSDWLVDNSHELMDDYFEKRGDELIAFLYSEACADLLDKVYERYLGDFKKSAKFESWAFERWSQKPEPDDDVQ
jgi:hypothetical protein